METAPCSFAARSPMLEPMEMTQRRIGRISPVMVSASMMLGFGVSVILGSDGS